MESTNSGANTTTSTVQKSDFSLITQDGVEVNVPAEFVNLSSMFSAYQNTYGNQVAGSTKMEMAESAPRTTKKHLEFIFDFLHLLKKHDPQQYDKFDKIPDDEKRNGIGKNNHEVTSPKNVKYGEEEEEETEEKLEWMLSYFRDKDHPFIVEAMSVAMYLQMMPFCHFGAKFVAYKIAGLSVLGEIASCMCLEASEEFFRELENEVFCLKTAANKAIGEQEAKDEREAQDHREREDKLRKEEEEFQKMPDSDDEEECSCG